MRDELGEQVQRCDQNRHARRLRVGDGQTERLKDLSGVEIRCVGCVAGLHKSRAFCAATLNDADFLASLDCTSTCSGGTINADDSCGLCEDPPAALVDSESVVADEEDCLACRTPRPGCAEPVARVSARQTRTSRNAAM